MPVKQTNNIARDLVNHFFTAFNNGYAHLTLGEYVGEDRVTSTTRFSALQALDDYDILTIEFYISDSEEKMGTVTIDQRGEPWDAIKGYVAIPWLDIFVRDWSNEHHAGSHFS